MGFPISVSATPMFTNMQKDIFSQVKAMVSSMLDKIMGFTWIQPCFEAFQVAYGKVVRTVGVALCSSMPDRNISSGIRNGSMNTLNVFMEGENDRPAT